MAEAGAAAVVLPSLFEEQILLDQRFLQYHLSQGTHSHPEALTYFPEPPEFHIGPQNYLRQIERAKAAVEIPIIASLNGSTLGGWTEYAKLIEQAGADALELNLYSIPTSLDLPGSQVEDNYLQVVRAVRAEVTIPLAVKVSPFFSNFANMAKRFDDAGANGLVLFNRFYQPDFDLESLEVIPNVLLSTPMAMRLPLRWIAILYGRITASLAATSGIHRANDAIKMLMAGADVTMLCSALLRHGIEQIAVIEHDMRAWFDEHEYESVAQLQGSMSQKNCPEPSAFERAQYMRALTTYLPD